ncbi:putative plant non-specific lipid-transfer protein/Par allergen [Dioscorea sansibarensis]
MASSFKPKLSIYIMLIAFILACELCPLSSALITCTNVQHSLQPCIGYVKGIGILTATCCAGVRQLNSAATTTTDRRSVCSCLKKYYSMIHGFKPNLIPGIPGMCQVKLPYPISANMDCSRYSCL